MVERCVDIADKVVRFHYGVPSLEVVTDNALVVGEKVPGVQLSGLLGHGSECRDSRQVDCSSR